MAIRKPSSLANNADNKKQAFKEGNMDNSGKLNQPSVPVVPAKNESSTKPAKGKSTSTTTK